MARLATAFLFLLLVMGAALGGAYLWFSRAVLVPGPLAQATTIVIASGSGLGGIARQLESGGVVTHGRLFELEARRSGKARALKPGEYRFDAGMSIAGALDKIVRHDVVVRFVTIPEGLVSADIFRILGEAEGLTGDVTAAVEDGDLLPET